MFERLKRWLLPAASATPEKKTARTTEVSESPLASVATADLLVIDVRSEGEFRGGAIEHAINVPLPQLAHCIAALAADKATPIVLYCASGARSGSACRMLAQSGYKHVTNAGGLYAAAAHLQREVRR